MGYKLALVDFDGTLADSMSWWLELPVVTLREAGIPEPEGFRQRMRESPLWEFAAEMEREYPELVREKSLTDQWYERMTYNYTHCVPLKDGAEELLRLLRESGLRVYLLSATDPGPLGAAAEHHRLLTMLDRVYSEAEVGSKHTEEPYRRFARELGIAPEEMLLVEDNPRNLAQARALGLGTVAVEEETMRVFEPELRQSDVYLKSLRELDKLRDFLSVK